MFNYNCSGSSVLKVDDLDNVMAGKQLFPLKYKGAGKPKCYRCSEAMTSLYVYGRINLDVLQPMYCNFIEDQAELSWFEKSLLERTTVLINYCTDCGWWYINEQEYVFHSDEDPILWLQACGSLQKYETPDDIPTDELRRYLHLKLAKLGDISPSKFEVLMGDFLKSEWKHAEVRHIGAKGGSGDGGVDFILIHADKEYLVQVKHRLISTKKREGVQFVRELNGVLKREGKNCGIFITSAPEYTEKAYAEVQKTITNNEGYEFYLLDRMDVEKWVAKPDAGLPWMPFIQSFGETKSQTSIFNFL